MNHMETEESETVRNCGHYLLTCDWQKKYLVNTWLLILRRGGEVREKAMATLTSKNADKSEYFPTAGFFKSLKL